MKQEINPKDTSGAKAFELWMKAITEIGHLGMALKKSHMCWTWSTA